MAKENAIDLDAINFENVFGTLDDTGEVVPPEDEITPDDEEEETSDSDDSTSENGNDASEEGSEEEGESSNEGEEGSEDSEDESDEGETEDGDPPTLVQEIKDKLGFEVDGDFEDSVEGLVELFKATAEKKTQGEVQAYFESFPEVAQHLSYLLNGGSSRTFLQTFYGEQDLAGVKLSEEDVATQEQVMRMALTAKGFDETDVEDSIKELKSSDILFSQANRELKILVKSQEQQKQALLEEQQRAAQAQAEQNDKFWTNVETTLNKSNSFKGIPVSEKEKAELITYLKVPVTKDGQTAFQVALDNASEEEYLAVAALLKKGFNIEGLVKKKAGSLKAQQLKDRLKNDQQKMRSAKSSKTKKTSVKDPDFEQVSFAIGTE